MDNESNKLTVSNPIFEYYKLCYVPKQLHIWTFLLFLQPSSVPLGRFSSTFAGEPVRSVSPTVNVLPPLIVSGSASSSILRHCIASSLSALGAGENVLEWFVITSFNPVAFTIGLAVAAFIVTSIRLVFKLLKLFEVICEDLRRRSASGTLCHLSRLGSQAILS